MAQRMAVSHSSAKAVLPLHAASLVSLRGPGTLPFQIQMIVEMCKNIPAQTSSIRPQLFHNPQHGDAERRQPRHEADQKDGREGFLPPANVQVVGAGGGDFAVPVANEHVVLVVAGPAVVGQGIEGEAEIRGCEGDEVEIA